MDHLICVLTYLYLKTKWNNVTSGTGVSKPAKCNESSRMIFPLHWCIYHGKSLSLDVAFQDYFISLHFHLIRLQQHLFKLVCHVYIYVLIKSVVSGNKTRCLTQPYYTVPTQLSSFHAAKMLRYFSLVPTRILLCWCINITNVIQETVAYFIGNWRWMAR